MDFFDVVLFVIVSVIFIIIGGTIWFLWDFLVGNWLFVLIGFIVCMIAIKRSIKKSEEKARIERFNYLYGKYGDENIVERIMDGQFWQGQTKEMLLDSLGRPDDKDIKVLKNKRREVWKYGQINARSYRTKIILENGVVIGYDC